MLENESNGTLVAKRKRLDRYGVATQYKTSSSRSRLEVLCQRAERGLCIYDKLTVSELRGCVAARQLHSATTPTKKADLIEFLEQADEHVTFRFLDLPPELRVHVYTYHLQSLSTMKGHFPTQPPITTVSKLLRQESLPLFYQNCTFQVDFDSVECDAEATRYFDIADQVHSRAIRKISAVYYDGYSTHALRFKLEVGLDGTLGDVPQVELVPSLRGAKSSLGPHDARAAVEYGLREIYERFESLHTSMTRFYTKYPGQEGQGLKAGLRLHWANLLGLRNIPHIRETHRVVTLLAHN